MKTILLLTLILPTLTFADSIIEMRPGSSIVLYPGERTTVICEGNNNGGGGVINKTAGCIHQCKGSSSTAARFLQITVLLYSGEEIITCSALGSAAKCSEAADRINLRL